MRRIGRLILVSVLLGGSLGLAPQALASSGMTGGPATVAPAAGTKVTLQGRLEVLEGDDFVHGRTIETYELVTAQGSYELRFGQAGPEVPPAGSTVTVQGTLNGSAITVAPSGISLVASGGATPASASPPITGTKRLAVILINFSDNTSQPFTPAFAAGVAFTNPASVSAFYTENSWGKLTLSGNVFGWYMISNTSSTCDYDAWATAADAAAAAAGVDLSSYDYRDYAFPAVSSCYWAGLGQEPGTLTWVNGEMDTRVMAHELGHNFGLGHANSYDCREGGEQVALSATEVDCTSREYGDPFSVMGLSVEGASGVSGVHGLANYERAQMGWLTTANTLDVTTSGTYTIAPVEPYNPTGAQALRIERDAYTDLLLEFRQPDGTFDNFSPSDPVVNGVTIRRARPYSLSLQANLIDTTPGIELMDWLPDYSDAPLASGRSLYDPVSGVLLTTQSVSASGAVVRIDFNPTPLSVPGKPRDVGATNGNGSATVMWTTPADNGRGSISGYTVTSSPDGKTCTTSSTGCTVSGLTNGQSYTFTATAANSLGTGPASDPSNRVTPSSTVSVKPTGTVVAWGDNEDGETNVPPGLSGVIAITAGEYHSLALKSDGTVVPWGWSYAGYEEDTVPAGLSGVIAVAAGGAHNLALKWDGTVVAWGSTLGNATTVPAGLSGVIAISAGNAHSLALKSDGTVVAWGCNGGGMETVPAGLSGVTAIAAGMEHNLALKSDGTVVAWGWDEEGETDVPAGLSGVIAIAAGEYHSLALKSDGTVVAWGYNWGGVTDVPAGLSGVIAVAAGRDHSLALKSDGTIVGWGYNGSGAASDPTGLSGVTAIAAGLGHSLALVVLPPHLAVSGLASPRTAGTAGSVTVTAKGASGATDMGYRGTVRFTSTDPAAVLPADHTFTIADAGTHAFSITLDTAGTQSVTATDTGTASMTGSQTTILVNPAAATHLTVSGFPSPDVAGVAHSVTVTARDPSGNTAIGYSGTVHFTSSDGAAVLPANATLAAGVGTFSVTLKTAGTQSVTATDTVTASITGTQSGIVVNPAGATTLTVSGLASPRTAGVAGSITVTAKDPSGNTAIGYSGTVHFTSSDGAAVLPANATLAAGVGTFSVTLKTVGTQSVTATDTGNSSITGVQSGIVVTPAAATTLAVSGLASPRTAGTTGSVTVTAKDAYGNTATGYSGTVHFSSSDGAAVLPANATLAAGVGTFSVTLRTAGTQSVTATDTVTASITGVQSGIVVAPAAVKTLVVSGLSSPRTAGSAGNIRVTAVDAYGNRVHGYLGTVKFTSSDTKAKLPANYTFTAADAGTLVFSGAVILKTAGTQSVTATDMLTKTIIGVQSGIVVKAAALKTLTVSGLTTPRTAGTAGNIRVTAVDAYGNRIPSYRGTVHFTSSDAKAKLPANYKFTAADAGTHVFTVILKTAGTQSLTATDMLTKTIKGAQTGIVVKAAPVKTLTVSGLTTPRTKGVAGTIRVTAVDAYGNRVSGYTGTIHFTSSDAKAVLPANYKFKATDAGTHVFTVTLKTAGTQWVRARDTVTSTITGAQYGIVVKS